MSGATAVRPLRAVVVPAWLAEVVRPRRAPVPWPEMARATLAICVPLSAAYAAGRGTLGVLPATGGLLGTMTDAGGPYLSRVKRVCSAAVFGGAAELAIGAVTHGHGWLAVVALVVVAGVSGLLSALGDIGSVTGVRPGAAARNRDRGGDGGRGGAAGASARGLAADPVRGVGRGRAGRERQVPQSRHVRRRGSCATGRG
jgi:hypothetical protein